MGLKNLSKKFGVFTVYFLMSLSLFELKDIFLSPSDEAYQRVLFSLLFALGIGYSNGFKLYMHKKSNRDK